MADAYGTIIVCGDYEGDVNAIADALICLKWNSDDVGFVAYEDDEGGHVLLDEWGVQYPTVDPFRDIYVFKDGRRISRDDADQSDVDKWKNENEDLDAETYSLKELSDLISPHLTKGTIELVAVATLKNAHVYCDRLVVRSDGSAESEGFMSEARCRKSWTTRGTVNYDPKNRNRLA